jgi:hypothetical protein
MATLRHLQTRITVTGSNITPNWYGDQLQLTGSSAVEVGQDPPSGASQGSLWWDTDDGNLFLYYEYVDGGVSQSAWVPATSLEVQTMNATSSSYSATASYVDIKGDGIVVNYSGDEIQLTGSAALVFPYTGSAEITGSLILTGSISSNAPFNAQSVMIGDGTDGSYRFNLTDGKLLVEKNILGIWNTSSLFF